MGAKNVRQLHSKNSTTNDTKLNERYVRKKYNKWSKKLYKIFFRKNSTKYVIVRMIDSKK